MRMWRAHVQCFAALLLLSGPSYAESATDVITRDVANAYNFIKDEVNILISKSDGIYLYQNPDSPSDINTWEPGEYTELRPCSVGTDMIVTDGVLRGDLIDLAYGVVWADRLLKHSNYPAELWSKSAADLELKMLSKLPRKDGEEPVDFSWLLAEEVNAAIAQAGLKIRPVGSPECGGGPKEMTVVVKPRKGKVHTIPTMFWRYCEKIQKNPEDRKDCDLWLTPLRHGEVANFGGVYRYTIEVNRTFSPVDEIDTDRYPHEGKITFE